MNDASSSAEPLNPQQPLPPFAENQPTPAGLPGGMKCGKQPPGDLPAGHLGSHEYDPRNSSGAAETEPKNERPAFTGSFQAPMAVGSESGDSTMGERRADTVTTTAAELFKQRAAEKEQVFLSAPECHIRLDHELRREIDLLLQRLRQASSREGNSRTSVPPTRGSRERALAITHLETAYMWLERDLKDIIAHHFPSLEVSPFERAKAAYARYKEVTGGKNFRGEPMPKFEELGGVITAAWVAATTPEEPKL